MSTDNILWQSKQISLHLINCNSIFLGLFTHLNMHEILNQKKNNTAPTYYIMYISREIPNTLSIIQWKLIIFNNDKNYSCMISHVASNYPLSQWHTNARIIILDYLYIRIIIIRLAFFRGLIKFWQIYTLHRFN